MEDVVIPTYLYQPNLLLEAGLMLAIVWSFFRPQYLVAIVTGILLVRPNERFDCMVQYPKMILIILLVLLAFNAKKLTFLAKERTDRCLALFLALIAAETVLVHRWSIYDLGVFIGTGLLLYLAIIVFMNDEKGIFLIGITVVLSCTLICFEPAYYHFTEPPESMLWKLFHWDSRLQAWGMWANANETAFIACLGCANLLALNLRFKRTIFKLALPVLLPFFAVVVALTGSRAGQASLLLLFAPFVLQLKSGFSRLLIALSMVAIVLVAHSMTPERLDKDASTADRFDLRYQGTQLAKEYPLLGVGFMAAREYTGGQPLHNSYVQAFAETGLAGGCLFLMYLYRVGAGVFHHFNRCRALGCKDVNLALSTGLYLSSIFYFFWGNQLLTILFFLIMAQLRVAVNQFDLQYQSPALAAPGPGVDNE